MQRDFSLAAGLSMELAREEILSYPRWKCCHRVQLESPVTIGELSVVIAINRGALSSCCIVNILIFRRDMKTHANNAALRTHPRIATAAFRDRRNIRFSSDDVRESALLLHVITAYRETLRYITQYNIIYDMILV